MAAPTNGSTLIPCLRYRDANAAMDWLVRAFGFQKQAVYPGPDNTVLHAQLTLGSGMVMLGSVPTQAGNSNPYNKFMVQPDETGMRSTMSVCLVVADADATYAKAKAAGAQMILDIADASYGGRSFICRDIEGHLWSIGTYDPWSPDAA